MLINTQNLDLVFKGFSAVVSEAYLSVQPQADKIAMKTESSGSDETYPWLGAMAPLREWIGPRVIHNLEANSVSIKNRKFESTVAVSRDNISDDKLGVFKPFFSEMGQAAARHKEELIFALLSAGFATNCYDGQFFFDTDHPVLDATNTPVSVSNMQAGAGAAWYLLDTSRPMRALIWQEREPYEFQRMDRATDQNVFMKDEYLYGYRARANAGYGLWQMAFGSKATLDATNYAAARAAMQGLKADGGRVLGIKPTVLVVPPSLEAAGLALLNTENGASGASNPWKGTAELVVSPYV